MINNELLAKVLGFISCTFTEHLDGDYDPCINILYKSSKIDGLLLLNVYELAHLCKEWAYSNNHIIESSMYNGKWRSDCVSKLEPTKVPNVYKAETEPEGSSPHREDIP